MRTKHYFQQLWNTAFLMAVSLGFVACSVNDDPVVPSDEPIDKTEDLADVTILFYGHGGGNLDGSIIENIRQFYKADESAHEKVKIVAQYKFSKGLQLLPEALPNDMEEGFEDIEFIDGPDDGSTSSTDVEDLSGILYISSFRPEPGSTFRLEIDPQSTLLEQLKAEGYYGEPNCDITCPDSLTNFINWAAKKYPAKQYVFILSDHGGGYMPHDDLPVSRNATTRGVIYDDGYNNKHFSVSSLRQAIKASNIKPMVIYFDACLMNCMEYLFEMKDVCDYMLASTYVVPGAGGLYDHLVECLAAASETPEYALGKYVEYAVKNWDADDGTSVNYTDMTLTRMSDLDHLGQLMRTFVDRLCDTYQNGTIDQVAKINTCTEEAVKVSLSSPYYDIAKYMSSICRALPEVYSEDFFNDLKDAFNSGLVAQYYSAYLNKHNYDVDYSVLLGKQGSYSYYWWEGNEYNEESYLFSHIRHYDSNGTYTTYEYNKDAQSLDVFNSGQWGGTLANTYEQLAFDKATGWSRWLKLNVWDPTAKSPAGMGFELAFDEATDSEQDE